MARKLILNGGAIRPTGLLLCPTANLLITNSYKSEQEHSCNYLEKYVQITLFTLILFINRFKYLYFITGDHKLYIFIYKEVCLQETLMSGISSTLSSIFMLYLHV